MTVESIAKTLGTGSGIDVGALVNSLVDAQYANKNALLTAKAETLTAQISGVARLKDAITGFSSALATLARSGSLATQPTSSNTGIVAVSALTGSTVSAVSTSLEVRQLATGQVAHSNPIADRTATLGEGTLTLTFGRATVDNGAMTGFVPGSGQTFDIAIDATNSSLEGVAAAINARGAGVTASILTDVNGSRLVLKGATGESQAFTLDVAANPDAPGPADPAPNLASLAIGVGRGGTTVGTAARDAIVAIDGIAVQRASNAISNLIPGVRLDLQSAAPGTNVLLGSRPPTENLRMAVEDVVATYNDLMTLIREDADPVTGALARDPAVAQMKRSLGQITLIPLVTGAPAGAPTTLAGIGVTTNRDGTLSVDSSRLTNALTNHPATVEAMFRSGAAASGGGLPGALSSIATAVTSRTTGLGASEQTYQRRQTELGDQQVKALEAAEMMRTRMTRQFASMDAKVAAYKSTQSFLEQQVDAWNAQR